MLNSPYFYKFVQWSAATKSTCLTDRLSQGDHSTQLHHVGVTKLAHDGRLLEKLDLAFRHSLLQCFHSHIPTSIWRLPHSLVYRPKLPRPQIAPSPVVHSVCVCVGGGGGGGGY